MTRDRQRRIARAGSRISAAIVVACAAIMIGDYVAARVHATRDTERVAALQKQTETDASFAPELAAEQDRITRARQARKARSGLLSVLLIAAASVFVASAKWLAALDGRRPVVPTIPLATRKPRSVTPSPVAARPSAKAPAAAGIDLTFVDRVIEKEGRNREAAIPILQAIQSHYRYLPDEALQRVCELSDITPVQIAGASSFYARFRRSPSAPSRARHPRMPWDRVLRLRRVADHRGAAPAAPDLLRRRDAPGSGGRPRRDRAPGLLQSGVGPDGGRLGQLARAGHHIRRAGFRLAHAARMNRPAVEIRIGLGSCGIASGAEPVRAALVDEARLAAASDIVKAVGCNGMCHREPIVEIVHADGSATVYGHVTPKAARHIARRHIRPRRPGAWARWMGAALTDLVGLDDGGPQLDAYRFDRDDDIGAAPPGKQKRVVLENCGQIDPANIDEYIARGGYRTLADCLHGTTPERVIAAITESGLRGRGGAGSSTGHEWSIARSRPSETKYVICNGEPGDPWAFADRIVLESDPHRVIEGLAIAAYAIGASEGFFHISAEHPLAVERIRSAIKQAEARGYLGTRVLGSEFPLRLDVREGAGSAVCTEDTALILSLEGHRGMPRLRPPDPAERGFRGQPTVVDNVETLASVPWILRHGPQAFAALGTNTSKGTQLLTLAGRINHGGLVEVPMGTTIREIVEDIGGGIKNGRTFKAVQIGGPLGGCIPARLADTLVDHDALAQAGAPMGSSGLVVLDDRDCIVDMARFFLRFSQAESCGKCTFCRIGTKRMLEILERLCEGRGVHDDLDKLEILTDHVSRGSLCGFGQTAPNPVATTLRYFREEYEAHLYERRCPAGRCRALIQYRVKDECLGCTLCAQVCPVRAIESSPYEKHEIKTDVCNYCDLCYQVCQNDAIEVIQGARWEPLH